MASLPIPWQTYIIMLMYIKRMQYNNTGPKRYLLRHKRDYTIVRTFMYHKIGLLRLFYIHMYISTHKYILSNFNYSWYKAILRKYDKLSVIFELFVFLINSCIKLYCFILQRTLYNNVYHIVSKDSHNGRNLWCKNEKCFHPTHSDQTVKS